jgi:hypothetical protein
MARFLVILKAFLIKEEGLLFTPNNLDITTHTELAEV